MKKSLSICSSLIFTFSIALGNISAESVNLVTAQKESWSDSFQEVMPIEKLNWAATIEDTQKVLGEAIKEAVSEENIMILKYENIDTIFGKLDEIELLFMSQEETSSEEKEYYLYSIKMSAKDSIENVNDVLTYMQEIDLSDKEDKSETQDEEADASIDILLSNEEWMLGNIPAEAWFGMIDFAEENVSWLNMSVDDYLLCVNISETDDIVQVIYQAAPYVVRHLSEQKVIADEEIDMSDEKWHPMIENLEWGMSQKEVSDIVNIKEAESDKEDYAKYQLEASQTIFGTQMDVFLYFDIINELGLVETVCEFDKEAYDDVQEEIYALYGTAAQTHTGAKVGSIYSASDIAEALKLIGVDEDKMQKTARLYSERALCVSAITNSDKEEKASFSIVAYNMSLFNSIEK